MCLYIEEHSNLVRIGGMGDMGEVCDMKEDIGCAARGVRGHWLVHRYGSV